MPTAVWVWDAHTLALLAVLNHTDPVRGLEWHPSAARLAIATGGAEFFLWGPEGACCVEAPVAVQQARWRSDGRALLLQDKNKFCWYEHHCFTVCCYASL